MRRFRDLPVGQKILAITALASGIALLITIVAALVYEATSFKPKALREMETAAGFLRPNLLAAVSFFDAEAAGEDLASLDARPEIRAAAIYDRTGRLFAAYARPDREGFAFPALPEPAGHRFHGQLLDLWTPISDENEVVGQLFLQGDLPPFFARVPQYRLMLVAVLFALLLASLLLLATLQRIISGPILSLARAAHQVSEEGDFRIRVSRRGADEIGQLTDAFNALLSTIEQREAALRTALERQQLLQERLVQAQKMESIGRLAGGVAHDFNNLLTIIAGSVELARDDLANPQAVTLLDNVQKATEQAADLTRQLLAFARKQLIEPRIIDPGRLVEEMRGMLRSLIKEDIELTVLKAPEPWFVRVDPSQLTQVLMNLAANARDVMPDGGRLSIRIDNTVVSPQQAIAMPGVTGGDHVVISVSDTGGGMSEETRRRLFEPFFTTKEQGKGTGLGLATCYGIVKQSDGHIVVESKPGFGTTFRIYLRRAAPQSDAAATAPDSAGLPGGQETVLVVEDNPLVRATTVRLLRAQGYEVLEAEEGTAALQVAAGHSGGIDLLVTDVVMPRMSGREVAERLRRKLPDLKVLYMSGYSANEVSEDELGRGGTAYLQKPYQSRTLAHRVRAVLDG